MEPLDELKTPSITEKEPMFQFKNLFKPTSKNAVILGTMMKLISVGIVTASTSLLLSDAKTAMWIIFAAVIFGALGEGLIMFTKEASISSLFRAAEDIKLNPQQTLDDLNNVNPQQLN
jgi:hypothetical protein